MMFTFIGLIFKLSLLQIVKLEKGYTLFYSLYRIIKKKQTIALHN